MLWQFEFEYPGKARLFWVQHEWISRAEPESHGGHPYLSKRIFEVAISSKKSRHKVEFGRRLAGDADAGFCIGGKNRNEGLKRCESGRIGSAGQ